MLTPETIKLRARFQREGIDAAVLGSDPMAIFRAWRDAGMAVAGQGQSPFALSTVDASGHPSIRMMDLVEADHGFVFVTHQDSRKGRDLAENGRAAICFSWNALGRQISVMGSCEKLSDDASAARFSTLPPAIQLVAAATRQSEVLQSRAVLEHKFDKQKSVTNGQGVLRPKNWHAYRLRPTEIEFWQRRPNELQDRVRYRRQAIDDPWSTMRVSP